MTLTRRACLGSLSAATLARGQKRPPNVILIMSDDQGYGDFSSHGNPHLKTPNLDRLAKDGAEFTRFYVSPLCAPTRASLLTGRYNLRCGVHGVTSGFETMRREEVTLGQAFRQAGYRTALVGKWHLGENYPYAPHGRGFDEFTGFRTGHWIDYWDSRLEKNGKPIRTKGFITDVLTDEAIRFVEGNRGKPFFLYLAYNAPHTPYQAPQALFEKYKAAGIDTETAVIYAMVENLDANVGRLLKHVDDDTVVLFLCDNGANGKRFNAGLRASKGSIYEGGVRSPLFVRWPGRIKPGVKADALSAHIDIYPTLLDLCGIRAPQGPPLDGISLVPALKGKPLPSGRMLFTHRDRGPVPSISDPSAVRTERYNLVNGKELYDVLADPGEERNIAAEHPQIAAKLKAAYEQWFASVTAGQTYERPPIPVGYLEENPAMLMATQSDRKGNASFQGKNGWAHDWVRNFAEPGDACEWTIDAAAAGAYEASIRYVGSGKVRVVCGSSACEAVLEAADATPVKHRDIVPRKETPDMPWVTAKIGTVKIGKGRSTIRVETPGGAPDLQVKELLLRR